MVSAQAVRRLGCDAVVSDESGRLSRLVRSATRRALQRRDRGCRYLGCDRPSSWSDAHHLVHWADGGETRLSNLVLLCRRHHRMVHEGRVPLRL